MKWSSNHREGLLGESGMATIRWLLGLWLLLAVTAIVPFATFAYDGHGQTNLAYDSSRASSAYYDVVSGFAAGEKKTGVSGSGIFLSRIAEFLAAETGTTLADDLAAAATRARNTVGPGSGGAYGTRVHTAFEGEVNALGQGNLFTERSYLNGDLVRRGTPGSVRLDVVNGPLNAPVSIFDLKTGSATLTPQRILEIQSHVPGGANVPVFQVRP